MNHQLLNRRMARAMLVIAAILLFSVVSYSGEGSIPFRAQSASYYSSAAKGNGSSYYQSYSTQISVQNAPWILLHFDSTSVQLGSFSYVEVDNANGGTQILDATSIAQWSYYSAFFNGNTVTLSLHVAPSDSNISIGVKEVLVGVDTLMTTGYDSCDNRIPSNVSSVGRIVSILREGPADSIMLWEATAWQTSSYNFVTVGHFFLKAGNAPVYLQFNVPPSDSVSGQWNQRWPIDPNDQYSIGDRQIWPNAYRDAAPGNDWAVFYVNENSVLSTTRGTIDVVQSATAPNAHIGFIGYGYASLPSLQCTQQTSSGVGYGLGLN